MDKHYLTQGGDVYLTHEEAAEYMGVAVDTIHYHLYRSPKKALRVYPMLLDGETRSMVKQSELDRLIEKAKAGRPRGIPVALNPATRQVIDTRENRYTNLSYRIIHDAETEPHWWVHCVEHATMHGVDTKREAIYEVAKPWDWCEKCQAIYDRLPESDKKPPSRAKRQT